MHYILRRAEHMALLPLNYRDKAVGVQDTASLLLTFNHPPRRSNSDEVHLADLMKHPNRLSWDDKFSPKRP